MNKILPKWTRLRGVEMISVQETAETELHRNQMENWRKKEIKELCEKGSIDKWNLPRMPMMQCEVKQLLRNKQDQDEAEAIKYLAKDREVESIASKIYKAWSLDRQLIKDCQVAMAHKRSLQVTFNNIVGATRFKAFEGSQLRHAICQKGGCGALDSWEHFQQCYQVPNLTGCDRQTRIAKIIEVCEKADVPNPARPWPSAETYKGQGLIREEVEDDSKKREGGYMGDENPQNH